MTDDAYDNPANMSVEMLVGVRIGLRLATELLDREHKYYMTPRDGRRKPLGTHGSMGFAVKHAADQIFALRDKYDPSPDPNPVWPKRAAA